MISLINDKMTDIYQINCKFCRKTGPAIIASLNRLKGTKLQCCNCSRPEKGWKNMKTLKKFDFDAEFARAEKELEENEKNQLEKEEKEDRQSNTVETNPNST